MTTLFNINRFLKAFKKIRKRCWYPISAIVIFSLIAAWHPSAAATTAPGTSANAAILVEAYGGTVLYEKNADSQKLIASTTKILTGLIVLENCDAGEKVVIPNNFPAVEGSSIYLKRGEELTVLDLLYGLLLESGNDAAVALALHVAGSIEAFADLMNERAATLGCTNSHFVNPHGLDHKQHYSSARDLALITAEAMKNKTFTEIVSTKNISAGGRYFKNHNKLLWNCPGNIGGKTGFTEKAGRSLVSCTEREGMRLICVTISAPNDWNDHMGLYDWAFREFKCLNITMRDNKYGNIPVISGVKENVSVHPAEDYVYVYSSAEKTELSWEISQFVYAPVMQNEKAGMIVIKKNNATLKEIPLLYGETVRLDETIPLTFFEKLKWSIFCNKKLPAIHYGYYLD